MYHTKRLKILTIILILSFIFVGTNDILYSKTKKKKKKRVKHKTVNILINKQIIVFDTTLNSGLKIQNKKLGDGKHWFNIYLAEIDLRNADNQIFVGKSHNNISGLSDFIEFINQNSRIKNIVTMVNASFWSAYQNYPIGPLVIDGEIVNSKQYRNWSSLFFDKKNIPYIENFDIKGKVIINPKFSIEFESVNKRSDSLSVCYYNHYAGDTIPFISPNKLEKLLDSAYTAWLQDNQQFLSDDDTEQEFDSLSFIQEFKNSLRQNMLENNTLKVLCKYIDKPSINKPYKVVVKKISTEPIEMPKGYCLISFSQLISNIYEPKLGDTLQILFQTNFYRNVEFYNAVSGTPRIATEGKYQHKAIEEGNSGKRFIYNQLPRTIVGYNREKTKLYLIAVSGSNTKENQYGASLKDLEKIAKALNLYDAINLDGGGSTTFVFQNKNLLRKSNPFTSRKVSVYLGVETK